MYDSVDLKINWVISTLCAVESVNRSFQANSNANEMMLKWFEYFFKTRTFNFEEF